MPDVDPVELLALEESERRQDYLANEFRCSSEGQEQTAEHFAHGIEVYAHAAERSGKSKIELACGLALCQGQPGLKRRNGSLIHFPLVEPPVRGLLGFDTYKLGGAAIIETLWEMLADWPYEKGPIASAGCPSYVDIFHKDAKTREHWSRLWIFPYDGVLPRSMSLDMALLDEPPPIRFLEAATARIGIRRGSHRPLRVGIFATPLDQSAWGPIKERYPEEENRVVGNRVRVRWSVFDNEALPKTVKDALSVAAKGSAYELAKLYGHHVNADGGNPWSAEGLQRLMDRTRPPDDVERMIIQREKMGDDGKELEEVAGDLLVWGKPIKGDPYYIVGDPAKGITDGRHDPDGLQVWNRRTRGLVAELDGYIGGWGLGNAMVTLARRYNDALLDPLVTGGYGEAMLSAIRVRGYGNLTKNRIETRPGHWETRIGTTESHELRGKIVGAVERAINTGQCDIPSASVISCWQKVVVKDGKVQAIGRGHDEKMICAGRAMLYLGEPPIQKPVKVAEEKPKIVTFDQLLGIQNGRPRRRVNGRTMENISGP